MIFLLLKTFFITLVTYSVDLSLMCILEQQRDLQSNKKYNPNAFFLKLKFVLICIHREASKFKQSVLTLVSPVSSTGIRNNNIICITPTMILCEDIKPIEHVLLHPLCELSGLICAWKHCNIKFSLYYWTHWSCWWIYHFRKKNWLNAIFHH